MQELLLYSLHVNTIENGYLTRKNALKERFEMVSNFEKHLILLLFLT